MSSFIELLPLVNAAKGMPQRVPINQLKKALIKAIDILISSDPTDRSASVLNTTKLFYGKTSNSRTFKGRATLLDYQFLYRIASPVCPG